MTTSPGAELRRLRSLVADLDAVVWEADAASSRFTFVSHRAWDMLGYPPKLWTEDPSFWADHVHPDDRERALKEFMAGITDGRPHDLEYRFIHRDGSIVWLRDIGHTVTDTEGKPVRVRGLMVDVTQHKLAEERRAEVEDRHRNLVEQLPCIVYIESVQEGEEPGHALYVSPQVEEILGHTPQEWVADPTLWVQRLHPDDVHLMRDAFRRVIPDGRSYRCDYRMFAKDGRVVWIHDEATLVRDPDGIPLHWQGVMFDTTEQHLADERVQDSELRYRRLVEQLPAIVYTESVEEDRLGLVYVSPQARELLGVDPEGWLGSAEHWLSNIHPDDRERVRQENDRADASGDPFSCEYRILMPDGRVVWLRDEASLIRDEDGGPLYWQGVMLDITRRMHAEEQLREAEERYRALVEQTPVVTYLDALDPSSATLYISPQVGSLLGYTPEEITAIPPIWPELIHPDDRERILAYADEAERLESLYSIEYRMLAKDGHVVWVHDQAQLVRDEDGHPRYWQGVWMDITERMRAMELEQELEVEREESAQLRELDRMKNTFLQAVSHDLRTPLAAILGLAVTLEREDVELEPREAKDLASRIAANARKLDRMVNDLLDLDRLSRGIVEPSLAPTDVGSLVSHLVSESDLVLGRSVLVHTEPVWAEVDAAKVERIVENLLANAVRHTPNGSRIWVSVDHKDEGVRIAVEDEGPGVAPDQRERIFEPFRQGPDAPEDSPGVGVGLALVARFAELHGGRAWVEDREAGNGAAFLVWLPVGIVTPTGSPTVSRDTTPASN